MAGPSIEINHNRNKDVSLDDIINVARGAHVHVPKQTLMLLEDRRAHIEGYIRDTKQPAYGFNRGFGSNVRLDVDPKYLTDLQENLIRSTCLLSGGVGALRSHPSYDVSTGPIFVSWT